MRCIMEQPTRRHCPAYAPALLRLCSIIELRECKTLEAITAILGCPVLLPALGAAQQLGAPAPSACQQRVLCQALWHAVNWLREAVNSFSADTQGYAVTLWSSHAPAASLHSSRLAMCGADLSQRACAYSEAPI